MALWGAGEAALPCMPANAKEAELALGRFFQLQCNHTKGHRTMCNLWSL